ncbi:DNA polymerase II, partial [Vibrio sp. 10N.222.55.C6]
IDLWLSTPQGPTLLTIQNEKPVFFVAQSDVAACEVIATKESIDCQFKPLEIATFEQTLLAACYTSLSRSSFGLAQAFNNEEIQTFESDIRLADRFLMERFIKGSIEFTGTAVQKNQHRRVSNAKCRAGNYLPTLSMVSLDIECSEKGVLYSI